MDQTVELYRLKDKVRKMDEVEQSLKAKMTRMQSVIKEKINEIKELQYLNSIYEKERTKQNDKCDQQSIKVSFKTTIVTIIIPVSGKEENSNTFLIDLDNITDLDL